MSNEDGARIESGQPTANIKAGDTHILVGNDGHVAVRWGTSDKWYVLSPGSVPVELEPQSQDQLGERGWIERPHTPRLGRRSLDLVSRCRTAIEQFDGHPSGAWSMGEQLFVALILKDEQTLDELDYTAVQAARRLFGESWAPSDPAEFMRWLNALRIEVAFPGFLAGKS